MKNVLFLHITAIIFAIHFLLHGIAGASDKLFQNVEITVGVMDAPAIGGPASVHAKSWERRTGGKVKVVKYPFGQLYEKFMNGICSSEPKFDVIFYAPSWAGDFYDKLTPVPSVIMEAESFDDIHPTYRDRLMKWDDQWIAVTVDGDMFNGYYPESRIKRTLFGIHSQVL